MNSESPKPDRSERTGPSRGGSLYVIFAAMLWGTTGTAQAFAPAGATSSVISAARLLLGGSLLLVLALGRRAFSGPKSWPVGMTLLAATNIALYQLLFFNGVAETGVAVGTLVAIGSSPIFAGLVGWAFRRERPVWTWYLATLLALSGSVLLFGDRGEVGFRTLGILYALGAGASYALYAYASKELLEELHPDAVMGVIFSLGAVLLLPFLVFGDLGWMLEARGALVILHLGVIATAASYFLFSRGLQKVFLARAITLSLAEPLTAAMLGVLFLGETLSLLSGIGLGLLFLGLLVAALGREGGEILPRKPVFP